MSPVEIMYVSAVPLLADGMRTLIEGFEQKSVVRIVIAEDNVANKLTSVLASKPNLIIIPSNLRGCLEFIAEVHRKRPEILIVLMGFHYDLPPLEGLVDIGVNGIVSTAEDSHELKTVISEVLNREPNTLERHYARVIRTLKIPDLKEQLTCREMQVLRLLATGLDNKEIAAKLGIKPKTVDNYIDRVFHKLGVNTRNGAVAVAFRKRLIT